MRCRPLGPRPVFVLAMAESMIVAAAVGWQVPLDGPVKGGALWKSCASNNQGVSFGSCQWNSFCHVRIETFRAGLECCNR
jgi:hypothetical protein